MIGLLVITGATSASVAVAHVDAGRAPTVAVTALAWYGEWYWVPWLYLLLAGLPVILPTGELRSPYARRVWRAVVVGAVLATCTAMFQQVLLVDDVATPLRNPVGWLPYDDVDDSLVSGVVVLSAVALGASATVAVVRRYRRSTGIERQQLRVVTAGVVASICAFVANIALQNAVGLWIPDWSVGVFVGLIPGGILVAVLRYRLFEIDRLLSRTVTYAMVSAVLVVVYTAVTVIPSAVFDLQSDVVVAAATLAAAAAFVPARRRVQLVVDHRFNRARYDAAFVSGRFAERLRHNVDLDTLARDLTRVLVVTVQAAHVSLWLRGDAAEQ